MLGVCEKGGSVVKRIERVYEYYRSGREIGKIDKRKSSVKEMRENLKRKDDSEEESMDIINEEDQLKYIMPKEILKEMGIEKDWDEEISYEWAYCDHFWEADVIVTRIPKKK